jgi:hypothetical protein
MVVRPTLVYILEFDITPCNVFGCEVANFVILAFSNM